MCTCLLFTPPLKCAFPHNATLTKVASNCLVTNEHIWSLTYSTPCSVWQCSLSAVIMNSIVRVPGSISWLFLPVALSKLYSMGFGEGVISSMCTALGTCWAWHLMITLCVSYYYFWLLHPSSQRHSFIPLWTPPVFHLHIQLLLISWTAALSLPFFNVAVSQGSFLDLLLTLPRMSYPSFISYNLMTLICLYSLQFYAPSVCPMAAKTQLVQNGIHFPSKVWHLFWVH